MSQWSEEEQLALNELCADLELTEAQVLRQSLRFYQAYYNHAKLGHQVKWVDKFGMPAPDLRVKLLEPKQSIPDLISKELKSILDRPYRYVFKPDSSCGFIGFIQEFQSCIVHGESIPETYAALLEVAEVFLISLIEDNVEIPLPIYGDRNRTLKSYKVENEIISNKVKGYIEQLKKI